MLAAGEIVVFAGPSLPPTARPASDVFDWRPPAMAGDFFALQGQQPKAIVLVDGLFDASPAVRHKEILSVIATGVPVLGAASMGALRAAELHARGMIGVGAIFQAFASGRLTRDDEVAVLHGPADLDWAPLTEALVNIRATLVSAVRRRVLAAPAARRVRRIAADLFYQDRTWSCLLDECREDDAAALRAWLPRGVVNLKARDALEALAAAQALSVEAGAPRPAPPHTVFSAALARQVAVGVRQTRASVARR